MKKFFCTAVFFLLILALVFACVRGVVMDLSFYETEYAALGTAGDIGMSQADLMAATERLLLYMEGDVPDLDVSAVVNGAERQVFNLRERAHMVDVAALFQGWMLYEKLAFAGTALTVLLLLLAAKERRLSFFARCYRNAALIFGVLLLAIGVWVLLDFESFWISFHHLFFRNDLWLLDPATSIMINMFPEVFFNRIVTRIVVHALLAVGIPFLAAAVYLRRKKRP